MLEKELRECRADVRSDCRVISVDASFRFLAPSSWGPDEPTAAEIVRVQGHTALHCRTVNSSLGAA